MGRQPGDDDGDPPLYVLRTRQFGRTRRQEAARLSLLNFTGFGPELSEQFHGLIRGKDSARLNELRHLGAELVSLREDHPSILAGKCGL